MTQTTYDVEDWYLPSVKQAVQDGQIAYIGHYKQPDFERIALNPPKLAVFSTMIEGTPDVREKLDELGIPLLVTALLEETPLGRMGVDEALRACCWGVRTRRAPRLTRRNRKSNRLSRCRRT